MLNMDKVCTNLPWCVYWGYDQISKTRSVLQISSLKSGSGDSSKGSGRWSHHNKPGVDKKNPCAETLKSVISNRFVWNLRLCEWLWWMCGAYYNTPNPHTLYHTPPPASTLRKERRKLRKQVAESGSRENLQRVDWGTFLDKMRERTGERMRKNVGHDAASEVRQNVKAVRTKWESV